MYSPLFYFVTTLVFGGACICALWHIRKHKKNLF